MSRVKYAQVGVGGRAEMFYKAIHTTYKDTAELVAICDLSQTRMDYTNRQIVDKYEGTAMPTYKYTEFEKMIDETKPSVVIVTSVDRTHHEYIIRAMEKGCDVISEKPMTTDENKAQAIIDCIKRTGRSLRVTFNYRYSPGNTKVRELIMDGVIGDVYSVHFEWLLNTKHGADYFRRWHRNKANSGGLLVHKSTHHFDLVNFWLGSNPKKVFAFGELNFYGQQNAEKRGVENFYYRSTGNPAAEGDHFAIDLNASEKMKGLYLDAEADSGYLRDRSVFGDDISIEDTMGVLVQYENKAILTYSLNSYLPWEGFTVSINGSKGRIEYGNVEKSYVNSGGDAALEGATKSRILRVHPMFAEPYNVDYPIKEGGHGGGDVVMLEEIFGNAEPDKFNRKASHIDGAMSILTGVAGNKSIASGMPVNIRDLVRFD